MRACCKGELSVGGDGDDGGGDAGGPGFFDGVGGNAEGGSRGGHVVNEADMSVVVGGVGTHGKGVVQIDEAVTGR